MSSLVDIMDLAHMLHKIVPLKVLTQLAKLQGKLNHRFNGASGVVHDNLSLYFSETHSPADIDRMAREFHEWERVRSVINVLAPGMSADSLSKEISVEGESHLDAALARGKGVILLGSHLNSVAMFPAIAMWRKQGYDIGVALPEDGDVWEKSMLRRSMEKFVGEQETVKEAIGGFYCQFNIRPIISRLKDNQIIGQTGDGWHSANFEQVNFLGRKLPFTTGSWSIAQMTGAAVVPMFIPGNPCNGIRIVLDPPICLDKSGDQDANIKNAISAYAASLEKYLLEGIPAWMHWNKPRTLDALVEWTQREIERRYEMN